MGQERLCERNAHEPNDPQVNIVSESSSDSLRVPSLSSILPVFGHYSFGEPVLKMHLVTITLQATAFPFSFTLGHQSASGLNMNLTMHSMIQLRCCFLHCLYFPIAQLDVSHPPHTPLVLGSLPHIHLTTGQFRHSYSIRLYFGHCALPSRTTSLSFHWPQVLGVTRYCQLGFHI